MVRKKNQASNVITEVPQTLISRPTANLELTVARNTKAVEVLVQTCDSVIQMVSQIKGMDKASYTLNGLKEQLLSLDPILTSIFAPYQVWVWTFADVATLIEQYGDVHATDVDSDIIKAYYFDLMVKVLENIKENLLYARDNNPSGVEAVLLEENAQ